ncbi:hypothetical protein IF650_12995 [Cellulosimicrobium terreum]|nr:hypothetical protein [Cellulosimicrobium terreum]
MVMYRVDDAQVRDATTGELTPALVGEAITIVTRDTTTPFPIHNSAGDLIVGSTVTVTSALTVPPVWIDSDNAPGGVLADLYLDWYHAGSGVRGPLNFDAVMRAYAAASATTAGAAQGAAATSAAAAEVSRQAAVSASTAAVAGSVRTINGTGPDNGGDVNIVGLTAQVARVDTALRGYPQLNPLPSDYASAAARTIDPVTCAYNLKRSNTRRWRAALARAGRQDYTAAKQWCNELWLGDSIMGGCTGLDVGPQPDGSTTRFARLDSAPRFYERRLAQLTGIPVGSTGLVRWKDQAYADPRVAYSSAQGATVTPTPPVGQYMEFTTDVAGDTVRVIYYDNFGSTVTGFSISVSGASSGANFRTVVGSSTSKWKVAVLSGATIPVGAKVRVTNVAYATIFSTVEVRNSAVGGLAVHNLATSGSRVVGSWGKDPLTTGYDLARSVTDYPADLAFDVVHVGFGLFDAVNPPVDPAQFRTGLEIIRNRFPSADVVLHAMPLPGQLRNTPNVWWPFLAALYDAADDLDLPLLDVHQVTGGYNALLSLGLTADNTAHYLPTVYAMWGRAMADTIA